VGVIHKIGQAVCWGEAVAGGVLATAKWELESRATTAGKKRLKGVKRFIRHILGNERRPHYTSEKPRNFTGKKIQMRPTNPLD
jgi:hypothetical protein